MTYKKIQIYPIFKACLVAASLFTFCSVVQAQIDWTGAAGDGLWETPGNWGGNNVPNTSSETAEFDTTSFAVPGD